MCFITAVSVNTTSPCPPRNGVTRVCIDLFNLLHVAISSYYFSFPSLLTFPRLVAKSSLLLRTGTGREVADAVLCVKLDANLVAEAGRAAIEGAGLDAVGVGHDLEGRVQAGTAVAAEEVLVDLARVADGVPGVGLACVMRSVTCAFSSFVSQRKDLNSPLVTWKVSRPTTALEVKAPPVH